MTCDDCPGGDDHTHQINPNWIETDIRIVGDQILFPRPLRPENVCFDKLANTDVDAEPIDAECIDEEGNGHRPMVWDPETCSMVPSLWPGSRVVEWDVTVDTEPGEALCKECGPGMVFALEINSGCISHICVDGQWECLLGGADQTGTTVEQICYDAADWDFPVSYGGGGGSWDAYGSNAMTDTCADGLSNFNPTGVEYSCWSDGGGSPGPSGGWNSLSWDPDTINNDPNVIGAVGWPNHSHPCSRPAFRMNPGLPVGANGPICWEFDQTATSGTTRIAAYDIVSGNQLPITLVSQPSCGTFSPETGPNGPQYVTAGTCTGIYKFEFALPSSVQAQNVRFLAWNIGGSNGTLEEIITTEITAEVPGGADCCRDWNNLTSLAQWLTVNDPGGNQWSVVGSSVCTTVVPGVAVNYGTLEGCDETSDPDVTTTTGGGGGGIAINPCTDCPPVDPCTVSTPHGTGEPSGIYVDACQVLSINGEENPEDAGFPASGFPEWWRQPFINGVSGSEHWIVMADVNGVLQWHQIA